LAPRARRRLQVCRWGLALLLGVANDALAQNQPEQSPSAQQLIDRLRQIQGKMGGERASEQELLERLRQLQSEIGAERASSAPQAEARLSPDQVRQRISQALGVQVLSVERVAARERPTYALKVMNPPGNYNAAFRVVTLLVDGNTGEVLGEAQATPDAENPDAFPARREPSPESGLELRGRTWR
jgi:hypothetical protein